MHPAIGKIFTIDKIVVKNKKATVYTFKVADYHSYYVSDLNIWTHNMCSIRNGHLAGKKHEATGVKFNKNGYPKFDSKFTTQIKKANYSAGRSAHFKEASLKLFQTAARDGNVFNKFTREELELFRRGKIPSSYTWHHHQSSGVMQLVDREIHRRTGHTGGISIWGKK